MKSNLLLMTAMILLSSLATQAQTLVGITAGSSFSNVKITSGGFSILPKMKTGITAGLVVDAPLSADVHFRTGLNFVQKGYTMKEDVAKETFSINYLELPLNVVYNANGFFIGAGPSLSYAISGMDKIHFSDGSVEDEKEKIEFGSNEEQIKPFDFGANFTAGYKTKSGFLITGNYTMGLSNMSNSGLDVPDEKTKIKNNCFGIKIGFMFGNSHKK